MLKLNVLVVTALLAPLSQLSSHAQTLTATMQGSHSSVLIDGVCRNLVTVDVLFDDGVNGPQPVNADVNFWLEIPDQPGVSLQSPTSMEEWVIGKPAVFVTSTEPARVAVYADVSFYGLTTTAGPVWTYFTAGGDFQYSLEAYGSGTGSWTVTGPTYDWSNGQLIPVDGPFAGFSVNGTGYQNTGVPSSQTDTRQVEPDEYTISLTCHSLAKRIDGDTKYTAQSQATGQNALSLRIWWVPTFGTVNENPPPDGAYATFSFARNIFTSASHTNCDGSGYGSAGYNTTVSSSSTCATGTQPSREILVPQQFSSSGLVYEKKIYLGASVSSSANPSESPGGVVSGSGNGIEYVTGIVFQSSDHTHVNEQFG